MTVSVSPTESNIQAALRTFCLSVLPAGVDVIEAQDNRVPEPQASSFVTMTPLRRVRLATNLHHKADCVFTASFAGNVMTVTSIALGNDVAILVGALVIGPGVPAAIITAQTSGPTGRAGTYTVTPPFTHGSATYSAGQLTVEEMVEATYQLSFHAANNTAGNMAQAVHQMLRDPYATRLINGINPAITPLYGSDARQVPFIDAEDQYEWRWTVDAVLQANVTVAGLSVDFVTSTALELIEVNTRFPPGTIAGIYMTEDNSAMYVSEDGSFVYVQEGS